MTTTTASANIAARLDAIAAARPEQAAIIYRKGGRWQTLTFKQLQAETDVLARGLERLGLRKGTRTVLMV